MLSRRTAQQALRNVCWQCQARGAVSTGTTSAASCRRGISSAAAGTSSNSTRTRLWPVTGLVIAAVGTAYLTQQTLHADALEQDNGEISFEKPKRRRDPSKEANRDAISSQHVQVKQSWENPGVYVWGSNTGHVAGPDSDEKVVKNPRRLNVFDGKLLRDMKLDRNFGAAIDEEGDLYLWGNDYDPLAKTPEKVLKGKSLRSLAISQDRVFALAKGGQLYSIPVSKDDQLEGHKPSENSWIPFLPYTSRVSYRVLSIPNASLRESITSVVSGLEHGLFLTSSGRLFSFASSTTAYPSRGQLGVPGVTWETRPGGAYDQPHLVSTLQGFNIISLAAGDFHSLALDSAGRVFGFGDNSSGQLGIDVTPESPYIDAASLLNTGRLYAGSSQVPLVKQIAAGGNVSYMMVDATRIASANDDPGRPGTRTQIGKVTADTWSFGQGISGMLGTGRWTHVQGEPVKIKTLSGLFEWDEDSHKIIPIRLANISVGTTHAAATMNNVTHVAATERSSENDTNWGADVVWWGGNEHYQLGTGQRANKSTPTYIGPLEKVGDGSKREEHRLQLTPPKKVNFDGRSVKLEQRVECGRMVSAVYSRIL